MFLQSLPDGKPEFKSKLDVANSPQKQCLSLSTVYKLE